MTDVTQVPKYRKIAPIMAVVSGLFMAQLATRPAYADLFNFGQSPQSAPVAAPAGQPTSLPAQLAPTGATSVNEATTPARQRLRPRIIRHTPVEAATQAAPLPRRTARRAAAPLHHATVPGKNLRRTVLRKGRVHARSAATLTADDKPLPGERRNRLYKETPQWTATSAK